MTPELEIVARRLIEGGVPPFATAGIIANLAHESGGDPEAVGDGGKSIGLAQWNGPRAEALLAFADGQDASPKYPKVQADFLLRELGDHPNLIEKLAKSGDAAGAADVFQRVYEKPAEIDPERSVTAVAAEEWLQRKGLDPQGAASRLVPVGGTGLPAVYPSSGFVPAQQEQGLMQRVIEGAKQGFGTGPIGPTEQTLATARRFGPLAEQAVRSVGTAGDLLGRAIGAVTGAGAAAIGHGARALGETPTGAQQLERDVKLMADLGLMTAPLASPTGLVTPGALMPKGVAEAPVPGRVAGPLPEVSETAVELPKPPAAMLTRDALAAAQEGRPIDLSKPATIPNLGRIVSTDEAKNLITETAQIYQPLIDEARRGVVTHEATRQLADQIGTTPEALVKGWKPGGVLNAEEMLAARDTLVSSAEAVMAKAKEAATRGGTANAELFDMLNAHRAIQETVQGYTAEAGRLLNQFNIMSRDGRARIVQEAVDSSGGQWDEIVRRLAAAKPEEFAGVVRELPAATTMDGLHFAWINGLLSSPTTHMANILGNTGSMLSSLAESAVAEALPGRGVRFGETAARVAAGCCKVPLRASALPMTRCVEAPSDRARLRRQPACRVPSA